MNQQLELEQERFKKSSDQLSHELRSPLVSLSIVLDSCKNYIPEHELTVLKDIIAKINGTVDCFSCQNNSRELQDHPEKSVLVSLVLRNILNIKKNQYKDLPARLISNFARNCNFIFIDVNLAFFKKILTVLIDNAVKSLDSREGVVSVDLELDHKDVKITIQDGGKGFAKEAADKIVNDITNAYNIVFEMDSEVGIGTKITLRFPQAIKPDWIAQKIYLNKDDVVVILDDDDSIYKAWKVILSNNQDSLCLKHFIFGHDAIDFIDNYHEKNKILFLADFELLKQELNGMQVIKHANIQRSILVTNHYTDQGLLDITLADGIKILPKQLISQVEIIMKDSLKDTNIVIIDDDKMFVDSVDFFLTNKGKCVGKYYSPASFLADLVKYDKSTKIFIDHDFKVDINGIDLAKKLHEKGYNSLYLFSGRNFKKSEIPDYLTVIIKTDIDAFGKFIEN